MPEQSSNCAYRDYTDFARAVYETGVLSDPWLNGEPRFGLKGVVLSRTQARALERVAERVAYLHQELVTILIENPGLLAEFYRLTPIQQALWKSAGGLWHGMARADLFVCRDGRIVCCELNSDTPSGQPEAILLNQLLHHCHGGVTDPNADFGKRYVRMIRASHDKLPRQTPLKTVGVIYPTDLTEDLGMITLFGRWLEPEGLKVVSGSPYNLRHTGRGLTVLDTLVDLVVRHYKTDWWGERKSVWASSPPYPDAEPLYEPLGAVLRAEEQGEVSVVNPFGSVVTQNKLSLAFFWEEQSRFSRQARQWIRKYIPETYRLTSLSADRLAAEQDQWVLKSDYGCEGAETVCGPFVGEEIWRRTLREAIPEHFVAQRFFDVAPDEHGRLPNYGVYLLGGSAAGYFTRMSRQSTEYTSITVPTFVAASGK